MNMEDKYTCGICGKKYIGRDKKEDFISHCEEHSQKILEYTLKLHDKNRKTIENELIFIIQEISLKVRKEVNEEWKIKNDNKKQK